MSNCNICIEKYNKTKKAKIICSCEFESCRSCAKEYIIDRIKNNLEEAHCMSCKIQWTRKFLYDNFEKSFINNVYHIHYENLLVERELSLLQITQPYVEKEIIIDNYKDKLNNLEAKSRAMEKEFLQKRINISHERHKIKNEMQEIINKFNNTQVKEFVRKCPNNNCHGFLEKYEGCYKCSLCNNYSCGDCYELLENLIENHICDKDILESVKLLQKDSKPCPKCSSMIYKINGCDQIFCVECHTAWNWETGNLITYNIHNPHYFEYIREQNSGITPRNPLDVLCGREIDEHFVIMLINTIKPNSSENELFICEVAKNILQIRFREIPKFQDENHDDYCRQLRINYMRNKINKEEFKQLIKKRNKEYNKKKEIFDILITFINCMTDIFYILVDNKNYDNSIKAMILLKNHTNEFLEDVSRTYNCKYYFINDEFIFI